MIEFFIVVYLVVVFVDNDVDVVFVEDLFIVFIKGEVIGVLMVDFGGGNVNLLEGF